MTHRTINEANILLGYMEEGLAWAHTSLKKLMQDPDKYFLNDFTDLAARRLTPDWI